MWVKEIVEIFQSDKIFQSGFSNIDAHRLWNFLHFCCQIFRVFRNILMGIYIVELYSSLFIGETCGLFTNLNICGTCSVSCLKLFKDSFLRASCWTTTKISNGPSLFIRYWWNMQSKIFTNFYFLIMWK